MFHTTQYATVYSATIHTHYWSNYLNLSKRKPQFEHPCSNCSCILRPYISSASQKSSHFRRLGNDNACQTGSAPKYRRILTFGPIVHRARLHCVLAVPQRCPGGQFVRMTVEMLTLRSSLTMDVPERTLGRDFHSSLVKKHESESETSLQIS